MGVRKKKHLFLGEIQESRKQETGSLLFSSFPSLKRYRKPSCICNILIEGKFPVHMYWGQAIVGVWNGEVAIFGDETVRFLLEGLDSLVIPPVSESTLGIIVPTIRIKS